MLVSKSTFNQMPVIFVSIFSFNIKLHFNQMGKRAAQFVFKSFASKFRIEAHKNLLLNYNSIYISNENSFMLKTKSH